MDARDIDNYRIETVERLARVESRVDLLHDNVEKIGESVAAIDMSVKQRGSFVAGAIAAVTAVWSVIGLAAAFFFNG